MAYSLKTVNDLVRDIFSSTKKVIDTNPFPYGWKYNNRMYTDVVEVYREPGPDTPSIVFGYNKKKDCIIVAVTKPVQAPLFWRSVYKKEFIHDFSQLKADMDTDNLANILNTIVIHFPKYNYIV